MKRKLVLKVTIINQKSRTKVLKIAVGFPGVESVKFGAKDKSQIEVVGVGVDAVELATSLRKKVGYAEIVTVAPVGEKEKELEPCIPPYWPSAPPAYIYEANYPNYQHHCCSIL